jgi:hypothetical protein
MAPSAQGHLRISKYPSSTEARSTKGVKSCAIENIRSEYTAYLVMSHETITKPGHNWSACAVGIGVNTPARRAS